MLSFTFKVKLNIGIYEMIKKIDELRFLAT